VSFEAPLVLLGLAALPALAALYIREQHRRERALGALVSAPLLPSLAPRRPGWRRHAPYALLALGAGALIVAAARPVHTVSVPVRAATVMLVNDVSASMTSADVKPSRLAAAKRAAARFLTLVGPDVAVGSIEFAREPVLLQSPTTDHRLTRAALASIRDGGGGTATGSALALALAQITSTRARRRAPGSVLLISDGGANVGPDPVAVAARARRLGIAVYTIAVGTAHGVAEIPYRHGARRTPVPVDPRELAQIAAASGGRAYRATNTATLSAIYAALAKELGHRRVRRGLTYAFAGVGLVALALAAAASLAWFGRLA